MQKLPECDRCRLNARTPYLLCTLHPAGIEAEECVEFDPDPNIPIAEPWLPVGMAWYDGHLVCSPLEQRWTAAQKLALLDWHPLFTGKCPNCGHAIAWEPGRVHWDCECGWKDDSV